MKSSALLQEIKPPKSVKPVKLASWSAVMLKIEDVCDILRRHTQESNRIAWEVGKILVEIDGMVDRKTWIRILTHDLNKVLGAAARSKNWFYQAIRLYRQFPRNPERAVNVGLGRMQRLNRIQDQNIKEAVLELGVPSAPTPIRVDTSRTRRSLPSRPTLDPVESLSVRQLGKRVDALTKHTSFDSESVSYLSRLITRTLTTYAEKRKKDLSSYVPKKVTPTRLEKAIKAFICELNGWSTIK